jgi:hypothetical protein
VNIPFIEAGWTMVVLLGLYGFYCYWEAGRAELAAAFRQRAAGRPQGIAGDAPRYRARCWWSLLACAVLAGGAIAGSL